MGESKLANMAAASSSADLKFDLTKEVKRNEVAIDELKNLPSSRAVYQKRGNLFFRTTIEKAKNFQQEQLDQARAKLQKLSSEF